jgi:hypothetical protein
MSGALAKPERLANGMSELKGLNPGQMLAWSGEVGTHQSVMKNGSGLVPVTRAPPWKFTRTGAVCASGPEARFLGINIAVSIGVLFTVL